MRPNRWRKRTVPEHIEAILAKSVRDERDCLVYGPPSRNRSGHVHRYFEGRTIGVHRLMWMLQRGDIPDGRHVCHTCDNPRCVNIDHLWLGTQRDNSLDMVSKKRQAFMKKTHCAQGHPFSPENTYLWRGKHRKCRICQRESQRRLTRRAPEYSSVT